MGEREKWVFARVVRLESGLPGGVRDQLAPSLLRSEFCRREPLVHTLISR